MHLVLFVDEDDDDGDGLADGVQRVVTPAARLDATALPSVLWGASLEERDADGRRPSPVRLLAGPTPLAAGAAVRAGTVAQGVRVGHRTFTAHRGVQPLGSVDVDVARVFFQRGDGRSLDAATEWASLVRSAPDPRAPKAFEGPTHEDGAIRMVVEAPSAMDRSPVVSLESVDDAGRVLDVLEGIGRRSVRCAPDVAPVAVCSATPPLRLVFDERDRAHPSAAHRSLRAVPGGALVARVDGRKVASIRVGGPSGGPEPAIERLALHLRAVLVRESPSGPPPIERSTARAIVRARQELAVAVAVWGQCGVALAPSVADDVLVVDPPRAGLVAFGDPLGLTASGGEVVARAGGRTIRARVDRGATPLESAHRFAAAARAVGLDASIAPAARRASAALPSADVLLRDGAGHLVDVVDLATTDRTLEVLAPHLALADGLAHFVDDNATAGAVAERALLRPLLRADERAIVVVVVPSYAGGTRLGESFLRGDRSTLRDLVVIDRAALERRAYSYTLAHELGHVLLDSPGHPDDYGRDTPDRLMDSDASDASVFGPRRISSAECARVASRLAAGRSGPWLERRPLRWPPRPALRPRASSATAR